MVLLHLMQQSNYNFSVAHCNFKLRGTDADDDARFVATYCEAHHIECFSTAFNTIDFAAEHQLSIQEAARKLRYDFFNELCRQHHFQYIITAHHADDQVETILINLIRGGGIAAQRGMLPKNDNRVKPLLFASKNMIETYADKQQIQWRNDATNDKDDYSRNLIRHNVIPILKKLNPSLSTTLRHHAEHIYETEKIVLEATERFKKEHLISKGNNVTISIAALINSASPSGILFYLLKPFGFNPTHIENITQSLHHTEQSAFYSGHYRLIKDRTQLTIEPLADKEQVNFNIPSIGQHHFLSSCLKIDLLSNDKQLLAEIYHNTIANIAYFDAETIRFPLLIRTWHNGDYFQPLGMKGNKLVSDFFTDEKYTSLQKQQQLLLLCQENIIWMIGKRISEQFKVTEHSKHVLRFEISSTEGSEYI
jgi:tRNA(Ile)-lysidine synthase